MLGWQFFLRQQEGEKEFASWFVGFGGGKWIRDLAAEGKAIAISERGYPSKYQTTAKYLIGFLKSRQPPAGYGVFVLGEDYFDSGTECWGIEIYDQRVNALNPDDVVIIDAWDQS